MTHSEHPAERNGDAHEDLDLRALVAELTRTVAGLSEAVTKNGVQQAALSQSVMRCVNEVEAVKGNLRELCSEVHVFTLAATGTRAEGIHFGERLEAIETALHGIKAQLPERDTVPPPPFAPTEPSGLELDGRDGMTRRSPSDPV